MDELVRRIGNLKEQFLSFNNLFLAYKKAFKSANNDQSYTFTFNREKELLTLKDELSRGLYIPRDYRYFTINDPKERMISVADFRDRVVHHALVNILEPIYERRFIFDSYATRKGRGTHRAITRAQQFIRLNRWYLKMDIKRYFYSINHEPLKRIIASKIKDPFILDLCNTIIGKGGDGQVGLPIGNLTSQFFANVYLDVFDHVIKDRCKVKAYLRYMDNFCIFSDDRNQLKDLRNTSIIYLHDNLQLEVKNTATMINTGIHGLPFLGVHIFPHLIRYNRKNFNRSFKKLKKREWEYRNGYIDYNRYASSMQSLTTHFTYFGNSLPKRRLYKGTVSKADPTMLCGAAAGTTT